MQFDHLRVNASRRRIFRCSPESARYQLMRNGAIHTSEANIGNKIVAVAVFDVNSVKNVIKTLIESAITDSGTAFNPVI